MKPALKPTKVRNQRHNCKGSVLTVSIMMTSILTFIAGGLSQLVLTDAATTYRQENSMKAFYLAEAGVASAYATLKQNFSNKDNASLFPSTDMGAGSYDVTILQKSGRVVIESVGTVKNVQRAVYVEVKYDNGLGAFDYGVFSNKAGDLRGNTTVNANIHSNVQWDLLGNTQVNGTASAVGSVNLTGKAKVTTEQENALAIPFPTFDFNYYYNLAAPADRYSTSKTWNNVNLKPKNGVIYVNGDVTIKGSSSLTGAIVATGKFDISGTFTQTGVSNLPALMSRDKSIVLRGDVTIQSGLIYSGGDDVEIRGNVATGGSIMSFDEIIGTGNLTMTAISTVPGGVSSKGTGLQKLTYHE